MEKSADASIRVHSYSVERKMENTTTRDPLERVSVRYCCFFARNRSLGGSRWRNYTVIVRWNWILLILSRCLCKFETSDNSRGSPLNDELFSN